VIVGRKVRLRPPEVERGDHECIVAWRNTAEMRQCFFGDQEITLQSHLAWYGRVAADAGQIYYAVDALLDPETAESLRDPILIGVVGLSNIDAHHQSAEFGRFMIGHPRFKSAGCGREAAYLVCDHAFNTLGLNRVWAEVIAGNERALGLYQSIGFEQEGVLREHILKGGHYVDVVRIAMLAADFRNLDAELRRSLWLGARSGAGARL